MVNSPRIGILVGVNLSNNMKAVLYNLARLVGEKYQLDLLVGDLDVPERLRGLYDIYRGGEVKGPDPAGIISARRICADYVEGSYPNLLMNACKPQTLGLVVARVGDRHGITSLVRMTGETFRQSGLKSSLLGKGKMWLLHEKMAGHAYSKADRILTIGPNLRDSLITRGYREAKITTLPQPFDPAPFRPNGAGEGLKENLDLEPDKKTVLFVGRISWYKGGDRLLKITEGVLEESRDYQFCLIGDGKYRQEFEEFGEGEVKLPGEVPHVKISSYYRASDLLVFPSRTEGLPNVILEALAAKLPIIASPVGEIPHYVSKTTDSVHEYVEYILNGEWKTDELPEKLDWENQKRAYLDLFGEMIENRR